MNLLVETARPKVNLTLRILGRRDDGYHALESLVAFAAVPSDRLTLDPARPRAVTVTGPFAGGIAG
ncbi:MAG: 4-(cytidine 5'-diphospho)-2-C-methyl-D-erythritol kinase, partial [Hyphomicrobiaceae bacterium]